MKPFLLGFAPCIDSSPFMSTDGAFRSVGENTGNLAFCYAIDRQLGGGLSSFLWHTPASVIDAQGGIGVITLANQLGAHVDYSYLVKGFRAIQSPLVGIGLGAQAGSADVVPEVPKGTLDWIRAIQDRSLHGAPNIGVRGDYSLSVLEHYGLGKRALVTGCPTLFINPDVNLGGLIASRFVATGTGCVAVSAGHQRWHHLQRIEASLAAIAMASGGAYVTQSPLEMVTLGRGDFDGLDEGTEAALRAYIAPQMSLHEFRAWATSHAQAFFSAAAWMEYLRRFDFVVGTRIHGVMLGLQSGIPGLCVAHDSRTRELCETMKVPFVMASQVLQGMTRDDLTTLFDFDPDAFDANRRARARDYVEFLRSNGLVPDSYLVKLADSGRANA